MIDTTPSQDIFGFSTPLMSPSEWIQQHRQAHSLFTGPRDTRIPASLPGLAQAVCAARFSLTQLRLAFEPHPEHYSRFRQQLLDQAAGLHGRDPEGHVVRLADGYLSRVDWREQDALEMILEFMDRTAHGQDARLSEELIAFQHLKKQNRSHYDRAVSGLISEARGNLMGLPYGCRSLMDHPHRFATLDEEAVQLLLSALSRSLGMSRDPKGSTATLPEDPAECWGKLFAESQEYWKTQDTILSLKPFEKASLYLLECLPVETPGHSAFVRYLIENEPAYRRLLAGFYAPSSVRIQHLDEETERYNRLPEHASNPVAYKEEEKRCLLYAVMLRPDVVSAIAEREKHKDIYRVISELSPKAHLPRILQEVQNVFGYVTPEAFRNIVQTLGLDPVDVIRVIASFKQYSADPGGDIIIYICKGTACFLRGQPELSRRLSSEIQAEEGKVGLHSIQFVEMDCFGVCHLAPVVKARDTFLGKRTADDIPRMLEQLLKGPAYENRVAFLNRIQKMLAPGHQSDALKEVCISAVIDDGEFVEDLTGHCLRIDSGGNVFARSNGHRELLGKFLPRSLNFTYRDADGAEKVGAVILDEVGQIRAMVHFPSTFLEKELQRTIKPLARVTDGAVWIDRIDDTIRLGAYTANAVAVERPDGRYRLIALTGPPNQAPPEEDEELSVEKIEGEDPTFVSRQDRLVLGFTPGVDSWDMQSYIAGGGYEAVRRILGHKGEPAWEPRDIVKEISKANLRGRGGAGFPTGTKWDSVRLAKCVVQEDDENKDPIKLIVANGDEGDPGAFMDRTLIQERPHQVIEGIILAALSVGARYGVIYVRKEYEDAVRRLEHALFQARRNGLLGENILATPGLHFDIDIRLGAGAFVAGEKRAIMRAIEGDPAEPTFGAISNTFRGLWGKPTLLNNVETFANVPLIIQRGGAWYRKQGTEQSGGSKIFSVAGIVKTTGLVEARFGRTLSDIIRICGGIQEGKNLAGVQIGGPSGAILSLTGVRSYLLHTPLDFDTFDQVGAMLGSGGLVFIGEDDDVVRLARHFTDWLSDESCGQCPPCLQGTVSLGRTLDTILQGDGASEHIHALWAKSDSVKAGSQCGLGTTAANPVTSALRFFPHAFLHHLLSNPRLNPTELFLILEALRLLTREDIVKIGGRHRQKIGYSFTLKKHLVRHLVGELERIDAHRPSHSRKTAYFLDLLQISGHEIGVRDVSLEFTFEELERHRLYIQDSIYDPRIAV